MSKAGAGLLYRAWLSDPALQAASAATRGIWINAMCFMSESQERGVLRGTRDGLAQLLRAEVEEIDQFLAEARVLKLAEVEDCNGKVTLQNRQMVRAEKKRLNGMLRVRRYRSRAASNAKVTPPPAPPAEQELFVLSGDQLPAHEQEKKDLQRDFEAFWKALPAESRRNVAKKEALGRYERARKKASAEKILAGAQAMRHQWENRVQGAFVPRPPMATTWLNQERWEADYSMPEPEGRGRPADDPETEMLWGEM